VTEDEPRPPSRARAWWSAKCSDPKAWPIGVLCWKVELKWFYSRSTTEYGCVSFALKIIDFGYFGIMIPMSLHLMVKQKPEKTHQLENWSTSGFSLSPGCLHLPKSIKDVESLGFFLREHLQETHTVYLMGTLGKLSGLNYQTLFHWYDSIEGAPTRNHIFFSLQLGDHPEAKIQPSRAADQPGCYGDTVSQFQTKDPLGNARNQGLHHPIQDPPKIVALPRVATSCH